MIGMEGDSAHVGPLPEGCQLCRRGSKMVLLVTGRCGSRCFYCPLSSRKRGRDLVFANELMVEHEDQVIEEAGMIDAEGTGITGGDPLLVLERTLRYVRMLKGKFGEGHHVHLYTSTVDPDAFRSLQEAGLDELRVHPSMERWGSMGKTLEELRESLDLSLGLEVPAVPGSARALESLLREADEAGLDFVNLNELEFSETNWEALRERGMRVRGDTSSAAGGSEALALGMLELDLTIPRHYCSSSFKDRVQLRRRIARRAGRVARPSDLVTDEGMLLKGVVETDDPVGTGEMLHRDLEVPLDLMYLDLQKGRLEVAPWVLEEVAGDLDLPCYLVEEYPTADRLEVERDPLNRAARRR
ncbi:MAG: radical SAM protein [Methanomassiliicoccales archaeon]